MHTQQYKCTDTATHHALEPRDMCRSLMLTQSSYQWQPRQRTLLHRFSSNNL